MTRIALIGTGLLGEAIGQRLLQKGIELKVWNRSLDRCQSLIQAGATPIEELHDSTKGCDAVITVLRDGPTTMDVVSQLGDLQGCCLIPMGTMGIQDSKTLASLANQQQGLYLEAPVLGSRPQALAGTLLVMAGGAPEVFAQQNALLKQLSEQPMLVGPVGSGAATKLALNQLIASLTHAFSISLRLIQHAGVPVETFMTILRSSALYAPTFDKKLDRMLQEHYNNPNFSTALLRKDLLLFLEETTTEGLNHTGLDGLATLLKQAEGTNLDDMDYCGIHNLTCSSSPQTIPIATTE